MAVEEQTQYNDLLSLYSTIPNRAGQELTIPYREVTKLGFWLSKLGSPTGDITFTIRRESDDGVLLTKVWGDAADLTTTPTYKEVTFDTPQTINELVRILVEFSGGDVDNRVYMSEQDTDVKADEFTVFYYDSSWFDSAATDAAYRYTYEAPAAKPPTFRLDPKPRTRAKFYPNLKLGE